MSTARAIACALAVSVEALLDGDNDKPVAAESHRDASVVRRTKPSASTGQVARGRCAEVGDELGSRVVAARLVREVMHLAFLLEQQYLPYSKWLGTAFARRGRIVWTYVGPPELMPPCLNSSS
jgi:hypothetical protein